MENGNYQRWMCELKIDGMHPQTTPLSAVFHLRFGTNGGICGTKEKSKEEENLRFNLLSRSTNGIKNAGDVFGDWTETGLCFTLVTRQQACKWEFQGKWEGKFKNVPEGRFKVTQDNFRMDTTVGTFKLSLDKKRSEENGTIAKENIFIKNMRQYISNSPAEKLFYDFKIVAQDGSEVNSHKIILASQTQYFSALFRQENPDFVKLDFPSGIIKMCVNYLYTEEIDVNGDNVQDIMVFANYVMIMEVVKICEDFIIDNLDQSTCLDVFKLGDFLGNSAITDQAKKMICRNFQTMFLEEELNMIPLHLFKQVLSSDKVVLYSEYETILPGIEREVKIGEMIEKYCLVNSMENEREALKSILRIDQKNQISSHRELSHLKTWTVSEKMGSAGDNPRHVQSFSMKGEGKKFIRKITLCTVLWDERTIIGGLTFRWSDGSSDTAGSMAEAGSPNLIEMEVPEGEHVSFVIGNSGWYVDNLTFVASSGRKIGPVDLVGGDGGGFRNPLSPLDPKYNSFNTYLDGVQGEEVVTQNKKVMTKLRFIYSCLTNGEEPRDVLAGSDMNDDNDEEENLEEMWNMNEEITDSSDDE
eukprot:GFUD01005957.1.p1 GENE.GFUD01005957.1~~GFUD01005957.1.p1  ORF type:complete len:585 (+),score=168.00 GFUD01005957.1:112-1866(+)